jgi:RNA polymerase sigma-70 factor (ECF subfamily)
VTKPASFKDTRARIKALNEPELVVLVKKQLPYVTTAYEELMRRYQTQLHSIALRYLNNDADAEEVVHEVMLKVFVNIRKFEHRSSFKTWIFRLAYNESVDKIRANSKHILSGGSEGDDYPAEETSTIHTPEINDLDSRMKMLNAVDRSIVVFRVQFELDFKEIADIVDLNISTVKMKYSRALEKLRNKTFKKP